MAQNKGGSFYQELQNKGAEWIARQKPVWKERMRKTAVFFTQLGKQTAENSSGLKNWSVRVYRRFGKRPEKRVRFYCRKWFRKASIYASHVKNAVLRPIHKVVHSVTVLADAMKQVKGQSFSAQWKQFWSTVWKGTKRNRSVFTTLVNYTLPVLGIALFLYVINFAGSLTFAVAVSYNGENLGYVQDESVVNEATEIVQSRMVYLDESERLKIDPTFSVEILEKADVLTEYQLADAIISLSDDEMVEAEGLYIDGTFYGAVGEPGVIKETLNGILAEYKTGDESEEISFVDDIQIISGLYVKENIITKDEVVTLLTGETQAEVYYTVETGDTPTGIAEEYDMKYADLKALNPNIEDPSLFRAGYQVLISNSEPFLPVQVKRTVTYTETVKYSTKTTESSKYAKGTTKVVQEGENGKNRVTANVTYVNNVEVSREIITTKVIKKPVTEEIVKGTATVYYSAASGSGSTGSGKIDVGFIWPFSGYISAYYGYSAVYGPSFHSGLDIARYGGALNRPIVACAGGTVIWAGWNGAYGKLIKIDHGNGVQTWYAHCNSLNVSAGQTVSQGQVIGLVGSTGNSTGPHLHLEVRINGVHKNPLNYLP